MKNLKQQIKEALELKPKEELLFIFTPAICFILAIFLLVAIQECFK